MITVYIACYNYENYVEKSIESVLNQTFQDFELLIFDDGSTDNSRKVINKYKNNSKVKIFFQENIGLARTSNRALKEAKGDYIIRLDADDYFDENILLILSNILDTKKVDLVYPDYYEINESGEVMEIVRRKKIGEETKLLDLPSHGACTMIRTKVLKDLGGYSEDIECQDGYDLWVKFIQKYKAYNVNLPLFYYRKHSQSLTTSSKRILDTRKHIKDKFMKDNLDEKKALIIIPIRRPSKIQEDLPLVKVNKKPLMSYVIEEALKTKQRVVVTTEDEKIAKVAKELGAEIVMRPKKLSAFNTPIEPTITHVIKELDEDFDVIGVIFYTSPLIKAKNMTEAINTLFIYNADSVVSVIENNRLHYSHDEFGLKPLFEKRSVKKEREFLYEESGAFVFSKASVVSDKSLTGKKISHVILTENESIDIEDKFTLWLVKKMLENQEEIEKLDIKKIKRGY